MTDDRNRSTRKRIDDSQNSSPSIEELTLENQALRQKLESQQKVEQELRHHKRQLDAIFDNAPVELYLKDHEGRYLRINRQFEKLFNVNNDDLVGNLPDQIHGPLLAAATRRHDLEVLTKGKILSREERALLPIDGQVHTLLTVKFPVYDSEGNINGLGSVATDISAHKLAEERIQDMVNTLDGIVWESDPDSLNFTYVSEQAERILGYPVADWLEPEFWPTRIHPEERDSIVEYVKQCYREGLDRFEIVYRFIARDGHAVWLRDLVSVRRESGQPKRVMGIMIDISKEKMAEQRLIAAEDRFRTIFMSATVGMSLADLKTGLLVEANPAYENIIGRSSVEMKQLSWQAITHPDDLELVSQQMKRIVSGEITSFKIPRRFIRPDNEIVWTESTLIKIASEKAASDPQLLAIVDDISERKEFEEKIKRQANYDLLTGLPNRTMLHDRLTQLIKKERRDGQEFALLLIDLDEFKDVNDTLGHNRGDELLIETAGRIKSCVRESDTVARLGGDEFVIIISELLVKSGVVQVAQSILDTISEPYLLGENQVYISASIGITLYPGDGEDMMSLIKNADQAMYVAKKSGRNQYHYFTQAMQLAAIKRMSLINNLRIAINENQFELHYQPIVDLQSGKIRKAEALIRWFHPSDGMISPQEFIPLAEQTRMINDLGDWVFFEAARQSKQWNKIFAEDFQISINASPVQFRGALESNWGDYLEKLNLDAAAICIEITENALMTSGESVLNTLLAFRDSGIQVSLDDFGTGYSSLAYLTRFDIDYLKIDQSFVQNLAPDSDLLVLCSAIVVMAHKLGIKVIAEGIETALQKELLVSIGCDYGQGYYYSKPIPAQIFEQRFGEAQAK